LLLFWFPKDQKFLKLVEDQQEASAGWSNCRCTQVEQILAFRVPRPPNAAEVC